MQSDPSESPAGSANSNGSLESEKGQQYESSVDSGVCHIFRRSASESGSPRKIRPKVSPLKIPNRMEGDSISQCFAMQNYLNVPPSSISMDLPYLSRKGGPTPDGSIYDASISMTEEEKKKQTRKNMAIVFSCVYAVFLTMLGGSIYINHQNFANRHISELFSICISLVGLMWLVFFHIDLYRYKKLVMKRLMGTAEQIDTISTCTDFNTAVTFLGNEDPPYRFLTGRHSGSFYLKIGLAAFCFGHLINKGLQLGQQILNYVQEDKYLLGCAEPSSIIVHIVVPVYSFYQLFIVFKYSNIVINRYKGIACFSLMHIIATCVCFWFGTIVEDALEDYHHKLSDNLHKELNDTHDSLDEILCVHLTNITKCACMSKTMLTIDNIQAIPYLYPFTIEFNLLLAGVWYIVWHNIGKTHHKANPHHFHHKVQRNAGIEEVTFQSNLVLNVDCHASNKGLFAGLLLLLSSIISIIVYFVAMNIKGYDEVGLSIHYFQEGLLTVVTMIGVILAYRQFTKLDFNKHPITFLDDILLFIPLPFFFLQAILTIMAEYKMRSVIRVVMAVLVPLQVILQTPFIIDGLRRCSNSQIFRYQKPGREIVTFLIVCNLTMWIINTFEAKSVESYYGRNAYFGEYLWMFISHTTLPLMLFYRFHSSVCLADIWKSAYEKGD